MDLFTEKQEAIMARTEPWSQAFYFLLIFTPLNMNLKAAGPAGVSYPFLILVSIGFFILYYSRDRKFIQEKGKGILLFSSEQYVKENGLPPGEYRIFFGRKQPDTGESIRTSRALKYLLFPYSRMTVEMEYYTHPRNEKLIPAGFKISTGSYGHKRIKPHQFQQKRIWASMILILLFMLFPLPLIPFQYLMKEWNDRTEMAQDMTTLEGDETADLFSLKEGDAVTVKNSTLKGYIFPGREKHSCYIDPAWEMPKDRWEAVLADATLLNDFIGFLHTSECLEKENWAPYERIFPDSNLLMMIKESISAPDSWEDEPFQEGSEYFFHEFIYAELESSSFIGSMNIRFNGLIRELKSHCLLLPVKYEKEESPLFPRFGTGDLFQPEDFKWTRYTVNRATEKIHWFEDFLEGPFLLEQNNFLGRIGQDHGTLSIKGSVEPDGSIRLYGTLGTIALYCLFLLYFLHRLLPSVSGLLQDKKNAFNFYRDEAGEMKRALKKRENLIDGGAETVPFVEPSAEEEI